MILLQFVLLSLSMKEYGKDCSNKIAVSTQSKLAKLSPVSQKPTNDPKLNFPKTMSHLLDKIGVIIHFVTP